MKANEFVKSYGLNSFKAAMACPQFARHKYAIIYSDEIDFSNELIEKHADYMFKAFEIKRLVGSHELVVQYGGLEDARSHLESIRFNIATKTWFRQALLNWSMYADKLEKAIADVEACKEVF